MGKGDKRSRKGKIVTGSYGKSRPKNKKKNVPVGAAAPETAPKKTTRKKKAE